jgi:steroid delta-isomerase-like uncharacterized protein
MTHQDVATSNAVDPAWLADFLPRWAAGWNSHDPDQLLALMTEDIVYDDSAWPTTMRGHADVREFLHHSWTALPDLRFAVREGPYAHPSELKAAFWWDGYATHTGPLDPPGLAATGKSIEFDGADFHEYRDGKVARLRIVFDMAGIMRQLGVLPPTGGTQERILAKVTNVRGKLPSRG